MILVLDMNDLILFFEENKTLILIIIAILALMILFRLLSVFIKDLIYIGSILLNIIKAIFKLIKWVIKILYLIITSPWQLWKLYKEIKFYNSFIVDNAKSKDLEVL